MLTLTFTVSYEGNKNLNTNNRLAIKNSNTVVLVCSAVAYWDACKEPKAAPWFLCISIPSSGTWQKSGSTQLDFPYGQGKLSMTVCPVIAMCMNGVSWRVSSPDWELMQSAPSWDQTGRLPGRVRLS